MGGGITPPSNTLTFVTPASGCARPRQALGGATVKMKEQQSTVSCACLDCLSKRQSSADLDSWPQTELALFPLFYPPTQMQNPKGGRHGFKPHHRQHHCEASCGRTLAGVWDDCLPCGRPQDQVCDCRPLPSVGRAQLLPRPRPGPRHLLRGQGEQGSGISLLQREVNVRR